MKDLPAGPAVPPTPPLTPASFSPRAPEGGGWYLKLEPGAPLPPDLPADAQRYRLVEDVDFRDRTRIAAGLVVAMVAAGVGLAWVGDPSQPLPDDAPISGAREPAAGSRERSRP